MAAIADSAAVEDQIALVRQGGAAIAPAAALDVVPTLGKARGDRRWRLARAAARADVTEIRTPQQLAGDREQVQVAAAVAVRQRRNGAIGTMTVQRELARARQPLVEPWRQRQVKTPRVLAYADEGSQRDVVVMRRALTVHAVGQHVGEQVLVQRANREPEQCTVAVERRNRKRGNEQGVELEGAVIPFVREVAAQIRDLRVEARADP